MRFRPVLIRPRSSVRSVCIGNECKLPADSTGRLEKWVNSHRSVFKSLSAVLVDVVHGRHTQEREERKKETKLIVKERHDNKRIRKCSRDTVIHPLPLIIFKIMSPLYSISFFLYSHHKTSIYPQFYGLHPYSTTLVKWISACAILGGHEEPSHLQFVSVTAGNDKLLRWIW